MGVSLPALYSNFGGRDCLIHPGTEGAGGVPPPSSRPSAGRSVYRETNPTVGRGIVSWVDILETWRPTAYTNIRTAA
jgi:hypothetical protein